MTMARFTDIEAERYRSLMNRAAESLNDEDAAHAPRLFEAWEPGKDYLKDQRLHYGDKLYKVLIDHTSHAEWLPNEAASLYAEVLIPDPSVIPDWVQPGSTNAYAKGDKVRHVGHIWISDYDNNVWEPGVFGWHIEEET